MTDPPISDDATPLQRLLHRWFVQYNPLYLLSAALVLAGTAVGSGLHFVIQAGILPPPRSLAQWGASAVALGFVLLVGSVATTLRIRPAPR
jgi:hypothetical protein